ncbi:MAG: DUF1573 domain-containing protein, partial [Bacteroidota bacterium]
SANKEVGDPMPKMKFDKTMIDFGKVKKGEKKTGVYHFTNVGTAPLTIDLVSGCECTTSDHTRGAVAPGETGKITIYFDSTEKEESEVVDVDVILENIDPVTETSIFEILQFKFELVE